MTKKFSTFLKIAISFCLLGILMRQIGGLESLSAIFTAFSAGWCSLAVLASFVNILLSGLRIWFLLRAAAIRVPAGVFTSLYVQSYCFGLILPGQTGDAMITLFLRRYGIPFVTTATCYGIDKIVTLIFMLGVSMYGSFLIFARFPISLVVGFFFVVAFGGLCAFFFLERVVPASGVVGKVRSAVLRGRTVASGVLRRKSFMLGNIGLTALGWLVMGGGYYGAFRSVGQEMAWPMVGIIPIMSSLVGYIPVSFAGVGTVEYSAVYLFSLLGVAKAVVLAVYVIQRVIQYALAVLLLVIFVALGHRVTRLGEEVGSL